MVLYFRPPRTTLPFPVLHVFLRNIRQVFVGSRTSAADYREMIAILWKFLRKQKPVVRKSVSPTYPLLLYMITLPVELPSPRTSICKKKKGRMFIRRSG